MSEPFTPSPRAFVDSPQGPCSYCGKRKVVLIVTDENGAHERHTCIGCDPWTTLPEDRDPYGLAGGAYELCSEDDPAVIAGRALRKRRAS